MEHIYHKKFNSVNASIKKVWGCIFTESTLLWKRSENAPRAVKKVFLSKEANTSELRGTLEKNKFLFRR